MAPGEAARDAGRPDLGGRRRPPPRAPGSWGVVVGAILLSEVNSYLLPRVLYRAPGELGLDFDRSEVASGIYGLLLVTIMLLRPEGLLADESRRSRRS